MTPRSPSGRGEREGLEVPAGLADAEPPAVPLAALIAARAADSKLGTQTVVMSMSEMLGVVDAFVITSGRNGRQVRALSEEIERAVELTGGASPIAIEGLADASWVLMDYGDFVVHVFIEETRSYYDLEHLWSAAPRVEWQPDTQDAVHGGAWPPER
ncbi:MAG: ribosome silencing factor [Acidimicrobiales bacterium]